MPPDPALDAVLRLAPEDVGPALVALPEGHWFDRKSIRIRRAQLAQTEVAFANSEGGTIVIGIHDGRVEGTDGQPQHRNALMQAAVDQSEPPVRARPTLVPCRNHRGQDDHLLLLDVAASDVVHATVRDEAVLLV